MSLIRSNLLNRALRLLPAQTISYYKDLGRANNEIGVYETNYALPVDIKGSLQAVPLNSYQTLGLDFGKKYVIFYTRTDLITIERNVSGDIFVWNNEWYQCQSSTDWHKLNGWMGVIAVETDKRPPQPVQDNIIIMPDGTYVAMPDGSFIEIPYNVDFVITPDGFFVTTPNDDFIIKP